MSNKPRNKKKKTNRKNSENTIKQEDTRLIKATGWERVGIYLLIGSITVVPFIIIVICWGVAIYTAVTDTKEDAIYRYHPDGQRESNIETFGECIYLQKVDDTTYKIVTEQDAFDKKMQWDERYDCYKEGVFSKYIWYDATEKEWHYWFCNVSGKYKHDAWLRCEENGWEIEESEGKWTQLPEKYSRTSIWHIADK